MKAQFRSEWQGRASEDMMERRKHRPKPERAPRERPKLRLGSLQNMLQERQHDDQIEHTAIRQKNSSSAANKHRRVTTPGWLVYYHDDDFGKDYRYGNTLQSLCLKVLAPALPKYVEALGNETMHHYLSLLPGPALTALSVQVSNTIGMSNSLVGLLNQTHATRLSIVAPRNDEETDCCWKALTKEGLESLMPIWGQAPHVVPDNWEDECSDNDDDCHWQWKGCRRLERLELGNMPHLSAEYLEKLLETCSSLSHLGLSGSCAYESGPEVLFRLPEWLPQLQFLDISGNPWVTENLLRKVFDEYNHRYPQVLQIKAVGCLPQTGQVTLELEYGSQFQATTI